MFCRRGEKRYIEWEECYLVEVGGKGEWCKDVAESKRVLEVHGVQMGRRKRLRDLVEG